MAKKRVLVVGLGNMGLSHALAYTRIAGFEVVGVCERHIEQRKLPDELMGARKFDNFEKALAALKPDVVSINTLPDTHAQFAIKDVKGLILVFMKVRGWLAARCDEILGQGKGAACQDSSCLHGHALTHRPNGLAFVFGKGVAVCAICLCRCLCHFF